MVARQFLHSGRTGPEPAGRLTGACDYCGASLADIRVVQRPSAQGPKHYCCLGCAFIADQLSQEQSWSRPAPAGADGAATQRDGGEPAPTCAQLDIRGMVCTACAMLLEHRLRAAPGVRSAHVEFVAHRALLVYEPQRTDLCALHAVVERTGYHVRSAQDAPEEKRANRIEMLRVLLAWLAMMQVMMLAIPSYLARPGEISAGIEQMLRIGQLVLSMPVALFCAAPFLRAAASQLRMARIGMDVPVAIGLAGAMGASLAATVQGQGAVYFDSVTMFIALLLSVRWWQMRALARATAQIDAAARHTRLRAQRLCRYPASSAYDTVAAERLVVGDHVLVPVGEAVPADGRIVSGSTSVSQTWLTGESAPLEKVEGDPVLAGSLNLDRSIVVKVLRAGDATSLAALQRMIIEAASRRPEGVEFANRIASGFAVAVLILAAGTAMAWACFDPAQGLRAAVAVLVVTCPCALSLAAPLALAVAQSRLAARGVLLTRPAALEALAQVDTVAFDKTGTLTSDQPELLALAALGELGEDLCLEVAAGLDAHSHHPLANALAAAARARALLPLPAIRVAEVPGMGVEGIVAGERYRLGKAEYALALARDPEAGAAALRVLTQHADGEPATQIVLAGENGPLAVLRIGETLRADAPRLFRDLAALGKSLLIASGDHAAAVERVARALRASAGDALVSFAEQSPGDKRALLTGLQQQGHRIAMVGDGINDAPVIAQANASIALASGSKLAQVHADVIVLNARLDSVRAVFDLSRRTARTVRQNLAWALAYNLVMVPLAALGLLAPWVAAAGMALSSAVVLANSWRLRTGRGSGTVEARGNV
jgi:Cu2+-exporting ATPase